MARWAFVGLVTAALVCGSASAAQPADEDAAQLRAELAALRKEVAELREKVEELEVRLGAAGPDQGDAWPLPPAGFTRQTGGVDMAALRKVKLPAGATKEQVRQYVDKILEISSRQSVFSSDDPQAAMLAAVGRENMDVLLDTRSGVGDMYTRYAIQMLADEGHKAMILAELPRRKALASVVLSKGWAEDARKILVDELARHRPFLTPDWIEAVASLRDPATYDDLVHYFVHGTNRSSTYEAIRRLPGLDLDAAVTAAWEAAQFGSEWDAAAMAAIAIRHGHLSALQYAVEALNAGKQEEYSAEELRRAVRWYTPFRGTDQQLARWFGENKDKLVFDPETRQFAPKEQP